MGCWLYFTKGFAADKAEHQHQLHMQNTGKEVSKYAYSKHEYTLCHILCWFTTNQDYVPLYTWTEENIWDNEVTLHKAFEKRVLRATIEPKVDMVNSWLEETA